MNCFEFRKLSLSDPYSEGQDYIEHYKQCDDCAAYRDGILSLDNKIAESIKVPVPDDLKARLKLQHLIANEQQRHNRFKVFSYAASVVMAVTVGVFAFKNYQLNTSYQALHDAVVQHIQKEPFSLTSVQATAQSRMQMHLASYADVRVGELPGLRYSQLCPIGLKKTWHAVMETPSGLVTLIYFKDGDHPEGKTMRNNVHSKMMQKGSGAIMLLSESKQAIPEAEKIVNRSLTTLI